MAFELLRTSAGFDAASAITEQVVVSLHTAEGKVIKTGSGAQVPFGVVGRAASAAGEQVPVYDKGNYVKVKAAASIGVGALVGVVGSNSLTLTASGSWAVGRSVSPAAAGEFFTCYVDPQKADS